MENVNKDTVTLVTECDACESAAREAYGSMTQSYELDYEYYKEMLHEWMVDAGLINRGDSDEDTLRYSVGFSQGDGASFELRPALTTDRTPEELAVESKIHDLRERYPLVYLAMAELDGITVSIRYNTHQYCHENTMTDDWGYDVDPENIYEDAAVRYSGIYNGMRLKDLAEQVDTLMVANFAEDLLELCRQQAKSIHRMMEDEIRHIGSDEAFQEWLEIDPTEPPFDLCDVHAEERDAINHYMAMQGALDLTVQM